MNDRPVLAIAHRAGNNVADLRAALDAGVDLVEADIHLFRGALEVRHRKAIGRHLFWEKWWEVNWRRDLVLPELTDVLTEAGKDPRLMLDLKGPELAVAHEVAALLRQEAPGLPITVCTKQWRMLDAFHNDPHVRRVFSASNWFQLNRLRARLRQHGSRLGAAGTSGRRAFGVSIHRQLLTPAIVAELHRAVEVVMVWPVDTRSALEHARWLGVSGVISKNLKLLRELMMAR